MPRVAKKFYSVWRCPKCDYVYKSPVKGTKTVGHICPKTVPRKYVPFELDMRSERDPLNI